MERFSQLIPLNVQEIFTWYFEQKGVDNPERFLGVGVNGVNGIQPDSELPVGSEEGLTSLISQEQTMPKTNEQMLMSLFDKVIDKIGGNKADILSIISDIRTNKKNKTKGK